MKSKSILALVVGIVVLGALYFAHSAKQSEQTTEPINADNKESSLVTVVDENGEEVVFDTSDWKTYENEEYGFSLRYPNKYILDESYEINRALPGNEYTLFLFNIKLPNTNDIGHGFSIDSDLNTIRASVLEEIKEYPERYIERKIRTNLGKNELNVWYSLNSPIPQTGTADPKINNKYMVALSAGYSFAEFQAILSTLEF